MQNTFCLLLSIVVWVVYSSRTCKMCIIPAEVTLHKISRTCANQTEAKQHQ